MHITVKRIDSSACADVRLPNEPFPLCGRMLPAYDGQWSYTVTMLPPQERSEMVFPDEVYDFEAMAQDYIFIGAYTDDGVCVGLAVYRRSWNRYMYLHDLKVNAAYRRPGIGRRLLEEGKKIAAAQGYSGIYTIGQDNNLIACLFYIRAGFQIGGLDTFVYKGTLQEGKRDIIFYLDF